MVAPRIYIPEAVNAIADQTKNLCKADEGPQDKLMLIIPVGPVSGTSLSLGQRQLKEERVH